MVIFFIILLLAVNFIYGMFLYVSTIEYLTATPLDANEVKETAYFQYHGKSIFEVASNPLFNALIFDKKYLNHNISNQLKLVLAKGASGYRRMIYSMLGILVMFFVFIFIVN